MTDLAFYLGTHLPHWLEIPSEPLTNAVPLFVSHRRLARYRRQLPRAQRPWALDSGGFTELSMYGAWRTTPEEYVAAVRRYDVEIGCLEWAAPQDWMVEPWIVSKTGLTVAEHQRRTVTSYLLLRRLWFDAEESDWPAELGPLDRDPEFCPFMPVLQGWEADDYLRCWELYDQAGVDLDEVPLVGLGSVCRRQATSEIEHLIRRLQPLRLHGFGIKTQGLARYGHLLVSADSMAWSAAGRREPTGCTASHRNEANCRRYALAWYDQVLARAADGQYDQLELEVAA
jgi:hypothetical protein